MANQLPTFDVPGMGRMTAAEFAVAYNAGRVPPALMSSGEGHLEARPDGRTVVWREEMRGVVDDLVSALGDPHWFDPLFYIGS